MQYQVAICKDTGIIKFEFEAEISVPLLCIEATNYDSKYAFYMMPIVKSCLDIVIEKFLDALTILCDV